MTVITPAPSVERFCNDYKPHVYCEFAAALVQSLFLNLSTEICLLCSFAVCCVPLLFVCFSFEPCFWDFFFPCDRQPHLRADSHLQMGWHCNGVGFGQAGRCGCRNLLPDTELV